MTTNLALAKTGPTTEDLDHENLIGLAYHMAMTAAEAGDKARHARMWSRVSELSAQRSPWMVAWLESEQGLD